jgi:hypothetical protein
VAKSDLRGWAVKGAEQRLLEIAEEAKAIFAALPELRDQRRGFDSLGGRNGTAAKPAKDAAARRGRRKMSAEARKRIGDAQRKRWAAKREQDAKAPASGAPVPKAGRKRGRAKVR